MNFIFKITFVLCVFATLVKTETEEPTEVQGAAPKKSDSPGRGNVDKPGGDLGIGLTQSVFMYYVNTEHFMKHGALPKIDKVPEREHVCGGSVFTHYCILTTAHCVLQQKLRQAPSSWAWVVYMGKAGEEIQVGIVNEIRIHPEYNASNYYSDLAILELQDPIRFSDSVQPALLWPDSETEQNIVGQSGTVVGRDCADKKEELKLLEIPVVSQETCITSYPEFSAQITSSSTYCAGSSRSCIVSGQGMFFNKNDNWYLRGVAILTVAKQKNSHWDSAPLPQHTIFADIAKSMPWIKENIKQN